MPLVFTRHAAHSSAFLSCFRWNDAHTGNALHLIYVWATAAPRNEELCEWACLQSDLIVQDGGGIREWCPTAAWELGMYEADHAQWSTHY